MGPGGTGGSGKLKSSKDEDTLRDGRKGDPLHKCCGKNNVFQFIVEQKQCISIHWFI